MAKDRRRRRSPSSSSYSSDSESSEEERRRTRRKKSSRHKESSKRRSLKKEEERRERSRKDKERRKEKRRSSPSDDPKPELDEPESVLRLILDRYPDIASDLIKLLEMLDNGQGVDLRGISDKSLVKLLKKLFQSLNLDQNEKGVFLLPPLSVPTLEVIGPTLRSYLKPKDNNEFLNSGSPNEQAKVGDKEVVDAPVLVDEPKEKDSAPSRRRVIGPEMPSRELLAAAAELTQAEATLREAEVEVDNDLFIGPPPPAIVAEAESANEAERFEEVSRIAGAEVDKPYDVLAVNWKMSFDNIKKRYWKLSLMVHPDKCSHPQAHQAFVILNQAFKDLQDPDKRKAIDEKIKLKEEQEQFEAELKELREAARWRQSQGISLEGDEELLAVVKEAPKRDEWMTTLPPEKKPGMPPRQSTSFSKTGKEGRGDTSVWTDSPSDRAEKAKLNYLEAYNNAKAISDIDGENSKRSSNASLVDEYNASKRSVSLLQKHQEKGKHPKKKSKQPEKEEWVGAHPWKPWDRENDLSAGRKKVDLDSKSMGQGLTSRFSSGPTQRNFL
ncbi:DnaJ domain-containing protein [Dioscorea alata]|uniref:DnaJ domain-containing protein n=1 Tax=Dioscorea alata TaxID=55571 RepID=A0ACB7W1H2_DIOAL|nr:DnaJ domain-containing protein [Dioscorea alata]